VSAAKTPTEAAPQRVDELMALVRRAESGDESALPAVRDLLNHPAAADLLGGDLARRARQTLVDRFTGKNLLHKEVLSRKLEQLQAELAGPTPTPVERLLVERVVTCWLHLHHLEQLYGQQYGLTLELGVYYQRSITAAQKRYLAALKALALVRKLAVPVLQVNIAKRQVNVAGPAAAADGG
jgi:hypothetical protein